MAFENDSKMLEKKNPFTWDAGLKYLAFRNALSQFYFPCLPLLLLISLPVAEIAALKFLTGVASLGCPMKQLFSFFLFPLYVCSHVIKVSCYIVYLSSTVTPFAQISCFYFFFVFFFRILPIYCVCLWLRILPIHFAF